MVLFGRFSVYGLLIALAIYAGVRLCASNEARLGLPKDISYDFALCCVPAALVGARLYYVAFRWDLYKDDPLSILYIWQGGLAIYGGILGGALAALVLARVRRVPFAALGDMAAPSLLLGQAIGRWGNFFNGEAYGNAVTEAAMQFFPYAVQIGEGWYQATFFYESLWDIIGFFILWLTRKKWQTGDGLPLYFILYGLGRVWIEGLRSDSLMLGSIRVSQALSALLVVCSVVYLVFKRIRKKKA